MSRMVKSGPYDLSIEQQDEQFILCFKGKPVKSKEGNLVAQSNSALLQHMIEEFDATGQIGVKDQVIEEPKILCSYFLFCLQKDWVERHQDSLSLNFKQCLQRDTILFRCAGPEVADQLYRWTPVTNYLHELNLELPNLVSICLEDRSFYKSEQEYEESKAACTPDASFVERIEAIYKSLSPAQQAVTMYLHVIHDGVVLFPLVLAQRKCNPNEYASGILACHALIGGVFGGVTDNKHHKMFENLRSEARTVLEYLCYFDLPADDVLKEIRVGESKGREFKSSLRWNIRANKNDDAMTHSCLKTIAAFLNTEGGVLYIGVDDEGGIVGISHDNFPNDDKFLLHLYNVIRQSMGKSAATRVDARICSVEGKKVCRVECKPFSGEWVFLRFKPNEEEFYVRTGPSSNRLIPSEMLQYMATHKK